MPENEALGTNLESKKRRKKKKKMVVDPYHYGSLVRWLCISRNEGVVDVTDPKRRVSIGEGGLAHQERAYYESVKLQERPT